MEKGFFIVLAKNKRVVSSDGKKKEMHWSSDLVEPMQGWEKMRGETIEIASALQKEQYDARCARKEPLPELVDPNKGPMATGQTVRFVSVS